MIFTLTLNPAIDRELCVPSIVLDEVLRATAHRVDWGGKGFNVSRSLRALGADSRALGFVGGDAGRRIAAGLAALGIATDFVEIAGETRTNVTIVDGARHLKVNEPGPTITDAEQARLIDQVRALARPGDWWVLAGSLPPGTSPAIYADVIRIVQGAGARAILDTSGAALAHGCEAKPFLVKPNAAEAAELLGRAVDPSDAARELHARGAMNVLLSLGRRGAVLSDGRAMWRARPPCITERNPIGAGDAMVAGMVWGLAQGMPGERALRWSIASGAAAAGLDGTAFGTFDDVAALERQVEVAAVG